MQKFQSALGYALWAEAIADTEYTANKTALEWLEARLLVKVEPSRKDLQMAMVRTHPEYEALEFELAKAMALLKMTRAVRQRFEGQRDIISREISRRDSEHRRLL